MQFINMFITERFLEEQEKGGRCQKCYQEILSSLIENFPEGIEFG